MNHMTDFLKNKVLLDNLSNVYVGLFNDKGEVATVSYKRLPVSFMPAVEGQTSNIADLLFPIATEAWGTILSVGIFDKLTSGNLLFKAPAEFIKTIDVSSQYKIPKNYLIVRLK
ncbi:hypothetical protein KZO01_06440 [Kurthia zopfii]|uniref:Uncharacterized protein n=1 Tax=Kurthia zopfii TaxID=1650 RepID=A0A8B4Q948_9BACL|nr:hypothetical protein [Kurthia zopfii]PWI23488.1 hypothetical protein DF281_02800 [Kurthia zopfii]TDR35516.1 hypothetical protein DFR61_13011 [Kurthia zopfii]GEK30335.1 hypothetical protein KZO01_06440 [Kurthia zopfii]STX09222.1 Uncharacterised protein [Kurthia zopfii]